MYRRESRVQATLTLANCTSITQRPHGENQRSRTSSPMLIFKLDGVSTVTLSVERPASMPRQFFLDHASRTRSTLAGLKVSRLHPYTSALSLRLLAVRARLPIAWTTGPTRQSEYSEALPSCSSQTTDGLPRQYSRQHSLPAILSTPNAGYSASLCVLWSLALGSPTTHPAVNTVPAACSPTFTLTHTAP